MTSMADTISERRAPLRHAATRGTSTSRRMLPRPAPHQLRLISAALGAGFVVGTVDAPGSDAVGFALRDRVAWRHDSPEVPKLVLRDSSDVLGVPDWISDEQVVRYLGPGLLALGIVRSSSFLDPGSPARVEADDPTVAAMATAWMRSLGIRVVDSGPSFTIRDDVRTRRLVFSGNGKLALAAVEVFRGVRAGLFDSIPGVGRGSDPRLVA